MVPRSGEVLTVIPTTSNVTRIFPFQVLLTSEATGMPMDSKAQVEQLRAVGTDRIGNTVIGRVPAHLMAEIERAIGLHLQLH
jgi:mRNA interferase MazF